MAFWGIEVKPGRPYTHSFDRVRGRIRITQATMSMAIGSAAKKCFVQCNVGDKSPVLLCALLPDKTESLQLDLEFEEADDVVFSVIGPRSVHLTGYYVVNSQHSHLHDDSESFGEDIANTETEDSNRCSDEDEYEDSFINDGEPEVFTPSPVSSGGVDVEVVDIKKRRDRKGNRKRLKKKYQSVVSDDDNGSQQQNIANGFRHLPESEGEDNVPISSLCQTKSTANNMISEAEENPNKETVEIGNKMEEDDDTWAKTAADGSHVTDSKEKVDIRCIDNERKSKGDQPCNSLLPSDEVSPENRMKTKRKSKEFPKEGKTLDTVSVNHSNAFKEDKTQQYEANANDFGQNLLVSNKQDLGAATDMGSDVPYKSLLPSTEVGPEYGMKTKKKKRKDHSKKGVVLEADSGNGINALKEDKAQQAGAEADNTDQDVLVRNKDDRRPINDMGIDHSHESLLPSGEVGSERSSKAKKKRKERDEVMADSMGKDLPVRSEHDQKPTTEKSYDIGSDQLADGYQSEEKKLKKKRRKKSRSEENENVNMTMKEEKKTSIMEFEEKNVDARLSEVRTLSNGLIIEELGTSNSNGKIAALGRKVKVQYILKLKENGHVIDSNIGKSPYKFRLGDKKVIEGLNVGLEGMRVGDKRRLIIPPSMSSGSQGTGENIPPNSWLAYDVELVGVH